jgi:ABC-type uncharacterized transport system involved in gliding motility auxiliary subunit
MIFQCLGITGAILLLYGLLAFAVTHVSTWFFWTLIGSGLVSMLTFFVMALNRSWQKLVVLFISFNAVWILFYLSGGGWSLPILCGSCASVIGLIAWISKKNTDRAQWISAIAFPIAFTAAYAIFRNEEWSGRITVTGFIVLNILFLWVAKSFLKEMFQSRSLRYGTSAAIYSIIVGFILIVVNIGSQDFHKQFDFTAEKINTLSDQTVKVLAELKSPIKITAFYENQNQEQAPIKAGMKNLLDHYKAATKNIEVLFVDPDKEKILAEEKHAADGDILIEYNGQSHITKDASEQGVTQAILKVTRTNTPKICFTSGHGEMSLGDKEENPRSLSILNASLANEGYEPVSLPSLTDSIPADCTVVVIPSPEQRFPESEVALFGKYLENGGKLIALLDPLIPNTKIEQSKFSIDRSGFEELMKKWGINLGNNLMLEKHLMVFQGEVVDLSVRAMNYGNHPIVDSLKGKQTYFNTVQSVQKQQGFSGTSMELIKSLGDQKSWAETSIDLLFRSKKADPDGADILGPVNIAMAVEKEGMQKTQLVVFGDGDFISNGLIQSYEFNYDLFLNTLNWMSGDIEKISIRPKKIKTSAIELTAEESNTIFYLAIITLPMLVLIFGINLWWYRRRKG